jgi:hypothetical protein
LCWLRPADILSAFPALAVSARVTTLIASARLSAVVASAGLRCVRHPRLGRDLENTSPVELNIGVVLLEQANGVFIDRRPPHSDARRRAEEVQETLTASAPSATAARDERRALIAALVADEF